MVAKVAATTVRSECPGEELPADKKLGLNEVVTFIPSYCILTRYKYNQLHSRKVCSIGAVWANHRAYQPAQQINLGLYRKQIQLWTRACVQQYISGTHADWAVQGGPLRANIEVELEDGALVVRCTDNSTSSALFLSIWWYVEASQAMTHAFVRC